MAETRFGGDVRIYGKGYVEAQGDGVSAIVARALLEAQIAQAKARANHTGTQTFATISDGQSYVDGRIQSIVGAAPAALDTLGEIADALTAGDTAATALTAQVATNRTDIDAVTSRVTAAEDTILDLRDDVDALSGTAGTLATQASVDAVTTRVSAVEGVAANAATAVALGALDTRVGAVETLAGAAATQIALTSTKADVTALTGRVSVAETRLDGVDTTTTGLRTDVTTLQGTAATLRTDLDALSAGGGAATAAVAADVAALTTRVTSVEALAAAAATDVDLDAAVASLTAADAALDARIDALEIPTIFKATVGDGASSLLPVTHGLNSTDVELIVRDLTDGQRTFPVDIVTGPNALSLDFGSFVPAAGSIRVIVKAL